MKFFFPDSQDQIDPSFDFGTEERSSFRVRQRDDLYAHEALGAAPYDGILVSKAIVDGGIDGAGRYSLPQRHRLYRLGIRAFFRLDAVPGPRMATMGDCGAFSYVREETPPYPVDDVIDFYDECGFDLGVSVDHVILGFLGTELSEHQLEPPQEWVDRQQLTLELAAEFLARSRSRRCTFDPVGVAQGWSPDSMARSVIELQKMGYSRIALGGMVALKTPEILGCLQAVNEVRSGDTQLHLLGVTRSEQVLTFSAYGVTSFDSTSPFRQAFKDERDNYYVLDRTYTALRVPQVDGNAALKRRIQAGDVDQKRAQAAERACLKRLQGYDRGVVGLEDVLEALRTYELIHDPGRDHSAVYRETLEAQPWKACSCGVCKTVGIHVILFRGTERNKRRGFHNVFIYRQRLDRELGQRSARKRPRGGRRTAGVRP